MARTSIALAGDVIVTRALREDADDDLLEVAAVLRDADCAIANLELPLHDFSSPAAIAPGGMWRGAAPERAHDLAWLGITAVSRANNHAGDYGVEGLEQTDRALAAAGIASAGTGADLASAREPALIRTDAGVVALVSCTSTFPLSSMAGEPRPPIPGRPGVSPLRRLGDRLVEPAEALARLGRPLASLRAGHAAGAPVGWSAVARAESDPSPVSPTDAGEVLDAVRAARRQADVVVVAIHSHDQGRTPTDPSPAIAGFARECVDAGADIVAGHGSHVVRDVEMYRRRPILHGLGSLVFQPDTVPYLPAEAFRLHDLPPDAAVSEVFARRWGGGTRGIAARPEAWAGLIALVTVEDDRVEVRQVPVDLRPRCTAGRRGTPRLAR